MRTAILGAGALGIIIGALMARNGKQVDLIDSYKENVDALNTNGATVTGNLSLHQAVKALTPEQLTGNYDLVILLTKQTANQEALTQFLPHLHKESVVCTLQNGIPEESVASYVGRERTIGGAVGFGATWLRPGVSELTSTMEAVEKFAFEIGEIDGVLRPRLEKVKDILSAAGGTTILTNLMGIRWAKLLMNATFSGMSATLNCSFRDVLADPKAMTCIAHIADETIKVCHGKGYRMVKMQGEDMESLELSSKADIPGKMEFYRRVWGRHNNKASMLQDLEKGKKTEIDYINGAVCRNGRECGIDTPFNDKVVELVKEAEARKGVNDFSYLIRFDDIIARAK
ncbi:ketopantoate reductase family protein [Acetonema longum]|uniref:2-dehydropantoate 2-reductase n=1 Tax=Acetonema longum DSM 6540 TaxID=1009370 RepID=F7NMH0_9FIRM|nr:ketopantoate reductase family protein [Acetonema longum]EGO62768.1 2-dehydropantoate 2-reductase [Acetonema longum DSM 6540]